jgi:hypothetical protein
MSHCDTMLSQNNKGQDRRGGARQIASEKAFRTCESVQPFRNAKKHEAGMHGQRIAGALWQAVSRLESVMLLATGLMCSLQLAHAWIITTTITGDVSSDYDTAGIFGPAHTSLTGDPYTLVGLLELDYAGWYTDRRDPRSRFRVATGAGLSQCMLGKVRRDDGRPIETMSQETDELGRQVRSGAGYPSLQDRERNGDTARPGADSTLACSDEISHGQAQAGGSSLRTYVRSIIRKT